MARSGAEQAIAIARDPPVHRIAHETRHPRDHARQAPCSAQAGQHAPDGVAVGPRAPAVDQQERCGVVRIQSMPRQQRATRVRLHRRETIAALTVVLQQETHPAVAQHADAVEDDDRHLRTGWIPCRHATSPSDRMIPLSPRAGRGCQRRVRGERSPPTIAPPHRRNARCTDARSPCRQREAPLIRPPGTFSPYAGRRTAIHSLRTSSQPV